MIQSRKDYDYNDDKFWGGCYVGNVDKYLIRITILYYNLKFHTKFRWYYTCQHTIKCLTLFILFNLVYFI